MREWFKNEIEEVRMVVGCVRESYCAGSRGREELAIGGESGQLVLVCHTTSV